MNICLVGDFSHNLDEGFKNTSHYLAQELAQNHTLLRLNVKKLDLIDAVNRVRQIKPHIIHTIAQPTHQSFVFTYLLNRFWPLARTAISMLRPDKYFERGQTTLSQRKLIQLMKPDLVLTQTQQSTDLFRSLRCSVAKLPNGVDLSRFVPATPALKRQLRQKYKLDPDQPVALHVGHLEPARNLMALEKLPSASIQVVIAGSLYMGTHRSLIDDLKNADFHVLEGYQPKVEELYQLADCYVFPVKPGNSLAMPLSVLEAMACNLPVITTRFSGLVDAFHDGAGLRFIETEEAVLPAVQESLNQPEVPRTRQMVDKFSWQSVSNQLESYYEELCKK